MTSTAATLHATAPETLHDTTGRSTRATRPPSGVPLRIAVLDPQPFSRLRLGTMVTTAGLDVVVATAPGDDAVALIVDTGCDAVLLAANDPDGLTIELGAQLRRAVVVCSENASAEMVRASARMGAMGFLLKPIQPAELPAALAIAVARFADMVALRSALEDRKLIERAKGRLMTLHGTTEEAAFRWIRRRAMNTRRRMADVARDVLATPGTLHPVQ